MEASWDSGGVASVRGSGVPVNVPTSGKVPQEIRSVLEGGCYLGEIIEVLGCFLERSLGETCSGRKGDERCHCTCTYGYFSLLFF